ncbi:MAG TPA: tripartite tricarboxylate transporter substrate binding protein [Burkholderiales bacterium]|nr:tripartite tricarboxylate transporter substrate binding protein [Burkholderiales bacterium]
MKMGLGFLLGAVIALSSGVVVAQTYPTKPVRVVIPWPTGGANDVVGRIVFQKLSEQLGQQFVIENRGGASGTIGADFVAKGPADGYTIMVHSAAHVTNPHMFKKLPYDTLRDFTGVTPLAVQLGMLVVHPSLPAKTTKEFVALARARPGQLVYGSSGNGSFVHMAMALLNLMSDTRMVHVPFKGGGPAVVALASGELQAMTATIGSVIPFLGSNRLRALGVTSATRLKQFPDIPAIAEGIPGYEFAAWIAAFVPAATPKPIVDRLNAEIRKTLEHPEVVKIMGGQTLDPMPMSPEQFAVRLKSDYDKYEKLIKATGAKID